MALHKIDNLGFVPMDEFVKLTTQNEISSIVCNNTKLTLITCTFQKGLHTHFSKAKMQYFLLFHNKFLCCSPEVPSSCDTPNENPKHVNQQFFVA